MADCFGILLLEIYQKLFFFQCYTYEMRIVWHFRNSVFSQLIVKILIGAVLFQRSPKKINLSKILTQFFV